EDPARGGVARVCRANVFVVANECRAGRTGPVLTRLRTVADIPIAARCAVRDETIRRARGRRSRAGLCHIARSDRWAADRARTGELAPAGAARAAVTLLAGINRAVAAR